MQKHTAETYTEPCQTSQKDPLSKKCPYSKLFWSAFSRIRTEYGEIRSISLCSVRMRENADQNNSEYGYFSRSDRFEKIVNGFSPLTIITKRSILDVWQGSECVSVQTKQNFVFLCVYLLPKIWDFKAKGRANH